MLVLYRGHWIILTFERGWSCEITECSTSEILPTCASSTPLEGSSTCLRRAQALVDKYVCCSPVEARVTYVEPSMSCRPWVDNQQETPVAAEEREVA